MKKLLVGTIVSSVMFGLAGALIAKDRRKKAAAEETTAEAEAMDFSNVLKMHKEANGTEESKLSDDEISAMNDVSAQMGEADQEKEPVDPADLIEKPKKKAAPKKTEEEVLDKSTEE